MVLDFRKDVMCKRRKQAKAKQTKHAAVKLVECFPFLFLFWGSLGSIRYNKTKTKRKEMRHHMTTAAATAMAVAAAASVAASASFSTATPPSPAASPIPIPQRRRRPASHSPISLRRR